MGLGEGMVEIADQMEEDARKAKEQNADVTPSFLLMYSRQIRSSVKAAQGNEKAAIQQMLLPPEIQHRNEIEKFKGEFSKNRGNASLEQVEEELNPRMVVMVG